MIKAILFDKDGTLTDFRATWQAWLPGPIAELAQQTGASEADLAQAIGLDWQTGQIRPDGRFVTATNEEMAAALAQVAGWSVGAMLDWWTPRILSVPQVPVPGLPALMASLAGRGYRFGVLTNADAAEAEAHVAALGLRAHFDQVIGYDSGWGAKPGPGGALAFADAQGLDPAHVLIVGDGMTDMLAAQAAGMRVVAVLTGTLDRAALAPHAEAVLPDVTALPDWLEAQHP